MNKYEKMKRKEEIKETLKKILHVVSYVLSVAFIVLMVIVGAQSCSNNRNNVVTENKPLNSHLRIKKAISPNLDNYYTYYLKTFPSLIELSLDTQNRLCDYAIDVYQEYSSKPSTYDYDLEDVHGFIFKDGNWLRLDKITFKYRSYGYQNEQYQNVYSYRLYRMNFLLDYGYPDEHNWGTSYLFTKHDEVNVLDYDYDFSSSDLRIILNEEEVTSYGFNYFFSLATKQDFTFDINFNYNAPALLPVGNQLWQQDGIADQIEVDNYSDLYLGWFYSNGSVYDTIRYVYWNSDGQYFAPSYTEGNNPNGQGFYGMDDYAFYVRMEYYNSQTHASNIVNVRDRYWRENGNAFNIPMQFWTPTTTWRDNGYRSITLLTPISDQQRILLNSFNNVSGSVVNTDVVTYTDMGNVFTLIGSAFTSILPVLNVMVLPGITLGILMFIPLVAMLVFAIIRIIKK